MKRFAGVGLALALLFAFTSTTQASAQSLFVGAGGSFPTDAFDDEASSGWLGIAGLTFPLNDAGLVFIAEGVYGGNSRDVDDDEHKLAGLFGELLVDFGAEDEPGVYIFGGAGILVNKLQSEGSDDVNDNQFGLVGGAGYGFPLGGVNGWIEGRVIQGDQDTSIAGIIAGISISLGGG